MLFELIYVGRKAYYAYVMYAKLHIVDSDETGGKLLRDMLKLFHFFIEHPLQLLCALKYIHSKKNLL